MRSRAAAVHILFWLTIGLLGTGIAVFLVSAAAAGSNYDRFMEGCGLAMLPASGGIVSAVALLAVTLRQWRLLSRRERVMGIVPLPGFALVFVVLELLPAFA